MTTTRPPTTTTTTRQRSTRRLDGDGGVDAGGDGMGADDAVVSICPVAEMMMTIQITPTQGPPTKKPPKTLRRPAAVAPSAVPSQWRPAIAGILVAAPERGGGGEGGPRAGGLWGVREEGEGEGPDGLRGARGGRGKVVVAAVFSRSESPPSVKRRTTCNQRPVEPIIIGALILTWSP